MHRLLDRRWSLFYCFENKWSFERKNGHILQCRDRTRAWGVASPECVLRWFEAGKHHARCKRSYCPHRLRSIPRISDETIWALGRHARIYGPGDFQCESIQKKKYGLAANWWSFGVLIYRLLSGFTPFGEPTNEYGNAYYNTVSRIVYEPKFEWPDSCASSNAKHIVSKLLMKDPTQRLGNFNMLFMLIAFHFYIIFSRIQWCQRGKAAWILRWN